MIFNFKIAVIPVPVTVMAVEGLEATPAVFFLTSSGTGTIWV
jgi:hypothetical protein